MYQMTPEQYAAARRQHDVLDPLLDEAGEGPDRSLPRLYDLARMGAGSADRYRKLAAELRRAAEAADQLAALHDQLS